MDAPPSYELLQDWLRLAPRGPSGTSHRDALRTISGMSSRKGDPTSGLEPLTCPLRVSGQALRGFAGAWKTRIPKPISLPWLAACCTIVRSRGCQSGVNTVLESALHSRPHLDLYVRERRPCERRQQRHHQHHGNQQDDALDIVGPRLLSLGPTLAGARRPQVTNSSLPTSFLVDFVNSGIRPEDTR